MKHCRVSSFFQLDPWPKTLQSPPAVSQQVQLLAVRAALQLAAAPVKDSWELTSASTWHLERIEDL
jgi:hypothetical protein